MLGDLDNLPEEDKLRMASMVDQQQIRDRSSLSISLRSYVYAILLFVYECGLIDL